MEINCFIKSIQLTQCKMFVNINFEERNKNTSNESINLTKVNNLLFNYFL